MRSVDRIEYDARSGSIRTTLVKYLQFEKDEFGKNEFGKNVGR
jgi:hypothetical protein